MLFDRVAQLRVPVLGKTAVGSGYLVGDRLVLTAAHVVEEADAPAGSVAVRFPAVDAQMPGEVVWSGTAAGLDAALVALADPVPGLRWRPVRWGRLTGQRPGVPAHAAGFPRVLRAENGARVPDHPSGTVNPGVAFGERYDLNVDPPYPLAKAEDPSPWSGLSGASLFSNLNDREFLIGVVVIDTPRFRAGRLTSVPVRRLLADPAFTAVLAEHGLPTVWESVELALFDRPTGRLDSPASLLRADNAVVRLRGRAQLLKELQGWCDGGSPLAFGLLTGPGGQGKTRLAWQLCAGLRAAGWVAGFVASDPRATKTAGRLADSRLPTMVVIDYAETRTEQIPELISAAGEPASPVRLLLLARSAGEWWRQQRRKLRYHLDPPWQASLPALEDPRRADRGLRGSGRGSRRHPAPAARAGNHGLGCARRPPAPSQPFRPRVRDGSHHPAARPHRAAHRPGPIGDTSSGRA